MKTIKIITIAATVAASPAALFAGMNESPALSAANSSEKPGAVTPEAESVDAIGMALQLADYGRANDDAMALVTAALILHRTPTQSMPDAESETASGTDMGDKKDSPEVTPAALIADAEELAGRDRGVREAIESARETLSERPRRAVGGPKIRNTRVLANSRDFFRVDFVGGQRARVRVNGDGDTDLDLFVFDENNNLVASDRGYSDNCVVYFTPRWTGTFTIVVANLGSVWNAYTITTN